LRDDASSVYDRTVAVGVLPLYGCDHSAQQVGTLKLAKHVAWYLILMERGSNNIFKYDEE